MVAQKVARVPGSRSSRTVPKTCVCGQPIMFPTVVVSIAVGPLGVQWVIGQPGKELRRGRRKLEGMAKRNLRMVRKQAPGALGICEYCNMQFASSEGQYDQAEWDIGTKFSEHKCKREDVNQAAARIV